MNNRRIFLAGLLALFTGPRLASTPMQRAGALGGVRLLEGLRHKQGGVPRPMMKRRSGPKAKRSESLWDSY